MDTADVVANARKENISPLQSKLDVGLTLRQTREQLGMSVHDIAERIKFAPRQVEALEANDFEHLPEPAFLRGFVRSYARVLQLDDVALVASLPSAPGKQVTIKTQAVNVPFPTLQSLRRINVMWLVGALGVALVLGWFVLMHKVDTTVKSAKVVVESVPLPATETAVSAPADTGAQPVAAEPAGIIEREKQHASVETAEPEKRHESATATEADKTAKPAKVAEPEKKPEPAKIKQHEVKALPQIDAASAPAVAVKTEIPLEILKRRPLHFVFTESAWAEVIDSHGAVLLSRNNPRGTEKWIGGPRHEPYDISISHPEHVKLYYRGQEVDLSAYAGMDVAHLKVE